MRFEHGGVSHENAAKFNEIYLQTVNRAILFDDVIPVLTELKSRGYGLYVLTNGPRPQRRKIEECEAGKLFDAIFISSELGVGKPNTEVYEKVFEQLPTKEKSELLMVGDSFENDCVAAKKAGVAAVQVNRHNKTITDFQPQIESLYELLAYLS